MQNKKYAIPFLALVLLIPFGISALATPGMDETADTPGPVGVTNEDIEQAKQDLDMTIEKLHRDIGNSTDPVVVEKLEQVLAGVVDFKKTVSIAEQLMTATDNDKQRLEAELRDSMDKLAEHAGDRYTHTIVTPDSQDNENPSNDEISVQSAPFLPSAYADNVVTDFEFWKNGYGGCGSRTYNMEFSGGIDSAKNRIGIDWVFPNYMYVDNLDDNTWAPCIYVSYEQSQLSHYGYDPDGVYYCGTTVPDYNRGVAAYPCPYADPGELNILRTWVDYADDDTDNDRTINLFPFIRFLILN